MSQKKPNTAPYKNEVKMFKGNKKININPKDRWTGTKRGRDGTTNPGVTRKSDNPIKGIRDPIPQNPDNPLKEIRNLVLNRIRSQWKKGLTAPT